MIRRGLYTALFVLIALSVCPAAFAQSTFGVRAGLSADPDQFFIGGHIQTPMLGQTQHAAIRPNVEIGFGEGATTLTGNMELVYFLPLPSSAWSSYFGGGPGVIFANSDFDSGAHGGFNMLVGFQHTGGLFAEMKVGVGRMPGLKVSVGYVLKRH